MKIRFFYSLFLMMTLVLAIIEYPQMALNSVAIGLRAVMILILLIEIILLYRFCISIFSLSENIKNFCLSFVSIFITLLLLEAFFMFLPRTHGIGYSLANALWFDRYWKPFNSFGYRDLEPVNTKEVNIIFAGDSFAAGQGIEHIEDRFPDIIRTNLSQRMDQIQVINLAQTSFDTKSEYESFLKFREKSGIKADMIVLQYYGNDIDHIASKYGLRGDGEGFSPYSNLNHVSRWIVNGSYLFNYIYWMFPGQEVSGYLAYIEKAYADDRVFKEHMKEIVTFNDYANANRIKFLVVIFPLLLEVDLSHSLYVEKVMGFLKKESIDVIDLSPLFRNLPVEDRIVNRNDAHPSLKVHRLVGEKLTSIISQKISK